MKKKDKIIYWGTTILVSLVMAMSGIMYITRSETMVTNFKLLGIPYYIAILLGTLKILGALALVLPFWPKVKEWAYAGFTFTFIGAAWTHLATDTSWIAPLAFLALLLVSYFFFQRMQYKAEKAESL